jgi:phosphoheptose isomerase
MIDRIETILSEAIAAHQRVLEQDPAPIVAAVGVIVRALEQGGKVLAFGNGGSAADAQHLCAELVGRLERDRQALAAMALSADTSVITAIANDTGYEKVFARQIEALGRNDDVAIAISTSGRSRNVEAALTAARAKGLTTIALTGADGGTIGSHADVHINVPEQSTARVQEVHRTLLHIICELVERSAR